MSTEPCYFDTYARHLPFGALFALRARHPRSSLQYVLRTNWNTDCFLRIKSLTMVEQKTHSSLPAASPAQTPITNLSTARVRSSSFKYYIHDGTEALRLKLIGEMTHADVTELRGCWRTAKTTLKGRNLVLDLRSLRTVDESGRQWLVTMAEEGACYLPENYLATCVPGQHSPHAEPASPLRKPGLFSRLASLLRGSRVSTQAQ